MAAEIIPSQELFNTVDNYSIFEQTWHSENAKGIVIITHGVAEHSGRYDHVAQSLAQAGYTVVAYDLRGHGKSSGKRNYVNSFQDYLNDLATVLIRTRAKAPSSSSAALAARSSGSLAPPKKEKALLARSST